MTGLPDLTSDDFADSFQRAMPTGAVWPRDPDTTQRAAVTALMPTYERSWSVAQQIPVQGLPSTTTYLLSEWESSVGLPDPCAVVDQTTEQRQAHVVARLTQQDGPTVPGLIAYAATLGFPITITEFAPSRFGRPFGGRFYGRAWTYVWQVNAPSFVIQPFQFGKGHFGDPFRSWGNTVLQCELQRLAPAHTMVIFNYS